MVVKASVSITDRQDDFARRLVASGHYASMSAVVQHGLELVRAETEREEVELTALRAFFEERATGEFVSAEQGRRTTEAMIGKKYRALGI